MKHFFLPFGILLMHAYLASAQTRSTTVTALNNYVLYANADADALTACMTSLERYDGLFRDYVRNGRQLGGEPYEKPKASPFVDTDVFTLGEDDPKHLYALALKGAAVLPTSVSAELNKSMKGLADCSARVVVLIDSMSDAFSGPLITVTTDSTRLPFRLLYAARRELRSAKGHRDGLFLGLRDHYAKACPLVAAPGDYIHSVAPLSAGVAICERMMADFARNEVRFAGANVASLDSLCDYLEGAELRLLKGITPIGNSRQFPNKGNYNGFDLYDKYENILAQLRAFANDGRRFLKEAAKGGSMDQTCGAFHSDCIGRFNGNQGLLYFYNEYVLLIGGGKMKLVSDGTGKARYIYRGWSDGKRTLPSRPGLFWVKEIPLFTSLN
jgi:hypothetical protein